MHIHRKKGPTKKKEKERRKETNKQTNKQKNKKHTHVKLSFSLSEHVSVTVWLSVVGGSVGGGGVTRVQPAGGLWGDIGSPFENADSDMSTGFIIWPDRITPIHNWGGGAGGLHHGRLQIHLLIRLNRGKKKNHNLLQRFFKQNKNKKQTKTNPVKIWAMMI